MDTRRKEVEVGLLEVGKTLKNSLDGLKEEKEMWHGEMVQEKSRW
jgi:hypothetical protein